MNINDLISLPSFQSKRDKPFSTNYKYFLIQHGYFLIEKNDLYLQKSVYFLWFHVIDRSVLKQHYYVMFACRHYGRINLSIIS